MSFTKEAGIYRTVLLLLLVFLCLIVAGCSSKPEGSRAPVFIEYNAEEIELRDSSKSARYRLRPNDVFDINFNYMRDRDNLIGLHVLPDGTITCPGVGEVVAAGRTVAELDSVLTELYAENYRNADLSLILKQFAYNKVYVFGEVQAPGVYSLVTMEEGLLQSLAMAGGFGEHADKSEIALIRLTEEGYVYHHINLSNIERATGLGPLGLRVRPNDIIYVPRSRTGDLAYKVRYLLGPILDIEGVFWDIYAIANIDKVDRIIR